MRIRMKKKRRAKRRGKKLEYSILAINIYKL